MPRVSGPTRPASMSTPSTIFAESGRPGVMPVERPVVLNADTTSNSTRPSGNPVSCSSRSVGPTTAATLTSTTVIACRCTARESRLPKMFTGSPRRGTRSIIMKKSTKNVVTLMPPPTLAGPAPMNISTSLANQLSSCIAAMSTELKPADRVITDAKNPASTAWPGRAARASPGLSHSTTVM